MIGWDWLAWVCAGLYIVFVVRCVLSRSCEKTNACSRRTLPIGGLHVHCRESEGQINVDSWIINEPSYMTQAVTPGQKNSLHGVNSIFILICNAFVTMTLTVCFCYKLVKLLIANGDGTWDGKCYELFPPQRWWTHTIVWEKGTIIQ